MPNILHPTNWFHYEITALMAMMIYVGSIRNLMFEPSTGRYTCSLRFLTKALPTDRVTTSIRIRCWAVLQNRSTIPTRGQQPMASHLHWANQRRCWAVTPTWCMPLNVGQWTHTLLRILSSSHNVLRLILSSAITWPYFWWPLTKQRMSICHVSVSCFNQWACGSWVNLVR